MFSYYARAIALSMLALSASCSLQSSEPQRGTSQRGYTQTRQASRERLLGRVLAVATDPSSRQPSVLLVSTKGQDWTTFSAATADQESVERALAEQTNGKYNLDLSKAAKITLSQGALKGTTFYIAPLGFIPAGSLKTKDSEFIWVPLYEFETHMARVSKPNAFAGRKVYIEANLDTVIKSNNNALKSASGQQLPPKRTEERRYTPEKQQQLFSQPQPRQRPYGETQEQSIPYGGVTPYTYSPQEQASYQRPYSAPTRKKELSPYEAPSQSTRTTTPFQSRQHLAPTSTTGKQQGTAGSVGGMQPTQSQQPSRATTQPFTASSTKVTQREPYPDISLLTLGKKHPGKSIEWLQKEGERLEQEWRRQSPPVTFWGTSPQSTQATTPFQSGQHFAPTSTTGRQQGTAGSFGGMQRTPSQSQQPSGATTQPFTTPSTSVTQREPYPDISLLTLGKKHPGKSIEWLQKEGERLEQEWRRRTPPVTYWGTSPQSTQVTPPLQSGQHFASPSTTGRQQGAAGSFGVVQPTAQSQQPSGATTQPLTAPSTGVTFKESFPDLNLSSLKLKNPDLMIVDLVNEARKLKEEWEKRNPGVILDLNDGYPLGPITLAYVQFQHPYMRLEWQVKERERLELERFRKDPEWQKTHAALLGKLQD